MQAHRSIPGGGGQQNVISCGKVFAKSVHNLGMPLLCQLIYMVYGHKDPGVESKVHLTTLR